MACGDNTNNNCGEGRVENLLNFDGLKYIFSKLTNKLIIALGVLRVKATKPLHLERTDEESTVTVSGYVDTATTEDLGVVKVKEGNGLHLNDGTSLGEEDNNGQIYMSTATQKESGALSAEDKTRLDEMYEEFYQDNYINEVEASGTTPLTLEATKVGTKSLIKGSIAEATQEQSGVMSAEDKKHLDDLVAQSGEGLYIIVKELPTENIQTDKIYLVPAETTEEGNVYVEWSNPTGTADGWEKIGEVVTKTNLEYHTVELSQYNVAFIGTVLERSITATAYNFNEQVPITRILITTLSGDRVAANSVINDDGTATITFTRNNAKIERTSTVRLSIYTEDTSFIRDIDVYTLDAREPLLLGKIRTYTGNILGTFTTFDGSKPTLRYTKTGTYWIILPEAWGEILGDISTSYCYATVTQGGSNGNAYACVGTNAPGAEYNGAQCPLDCWGGIQILEYDKDGNKFDGPVVVALYYDPNHYFEATADLEINEVRINYFAYPTAPGTGGTINPVLSVSEVIEGDDGKLVYSLITSSSDYSTLYSRMLAPVGSTITSLDLDTGAVTLNAGSSSSASDQGTIRNKVTYSNGGAATSYQMDATVTQASSAVSGTESISITRFRYTSSEGTNIIPKEGGTFEPEFEASYITYDDSGNQVNTTLSLSDITTAMNAGEAFIYFIYNHVQNTTNLTDASTGILTLSQTLSSDDETVQVSVRLYYKGVYILQEINLTRKGSNS